MPPAKETYGAAILYFLPQGYKDWWDMAGRRFEEEIRVFLAKSAPLKAVVRSLAVPPEADLHAKARAAYDWIAANMRNTSLQTSEEREAAPTIERTKPDTVADILQRGEGTAWQLDYLFAGLVRELGGEANVVWAVNRATNTWDPGFYTMRQFAENLVAVRARGEDLEKSVLIDPGSGLVYGDVPWWTMGTWAFVETAKGMKTIEIPPGPPDRNKAETTMTIGFSEDNAVITIRWTKVMRGRRASLIDAACDRSRHGTGRRRSTSSAARVAGWPDQGRGQRIDDINVPYSLTCEGEYSSAKVDAKSSVHQYALSGLWVDGLRSTRPPSAVIPSCSPTRGPINRWSTSGRPVVSGRGRPLCPPRSNRRSARTT